MPYSPIANGFGCHVFLQCHLQYSTASGFSVSYIRNFLSGNFAGSVAAGEVTKYSKYGSPVSLALPCCKDWHRKLNRRYANGKKITKKCQSSSAGISFLFLCVYHEPPGESFCLITILCLMSSLSQIKSPRQEKPMGSKAEEEGGTQGDGTRSA